MLLWGEHKVNAAFMPYTSLPDTWLATDALVKGKVLVDDDLKVLREDKWHSLPPHAKLHFKVPQKVTKVDVDQLSSLRDEDVVRVTVSNAQHVRGHTVASTGEAECLCSLVQP